MQKQQSFSLKTRSGSVRDSKQNEKTLHTSLQQKHLYTPIFSPPQRRLRSIYLTTAFIKTSTKLKCTFTLITERYATSIMHVATVSFLLLFLAILHCHFSSILIISWADLTQHAFYQKEHIYCSTITNLSHHRLLL